MKQYWTVLVSRNSQNHFEEFRYPNSFSQQYALQYVNQLIIQDNFVTVTYFWGALWVMSSSHPVWRRFESRRRIGMVIPLSSSPLRSVPISRSCQSTLRAQWAHGNCRRTSQFEVENVSTSQYLQTFLILSHHTWQKRILILYFVCYVWIVITPLYTTSNSHKYPIPKFCRVHR